MTKSAMEPIVSAGVNLQYTIGLGNNGPDTAQNVFLIDAVPPNTTFVSFSAPIGTVTAPVVGGTGNITAAISSLPAGASGSFVLVVHVNPGAAEQRRGRVE